VKGAKFEFEKNENGKYIVTEKTASAIFAMIMDIKAKNKDNCMAQAFDKKYYDGLDKEKKLQLLTICLSGVESPESAMGCYAMNPKDYDEFKPFFEKALSQYHKVDLTKQKHITSWKYQGAKGLPEDGKLDMTKLGLEKVSMRVRTGRNLKNYPLPGSMTQAQRVNMEKDMKKVFDVLIADPNYGGKYVSITPGHENFIEKAEYDSLVKQHIMFKDMSVDKYLVAAGIAQHWPHGRGCYYSEDKGFIIWLGEEDHLRIMCMKTGTMLNDVFDRLETAVKLTESKIDGGCAMSADYGVITSCPTNMGTGMRASVHVKLPNLCADGTEAKAVEVCKPMGLSVRGTGGEHTPIVGGVVDISPSARFCISEAEIVIALYNGIKDLMVKEKAAAAK